jgi:parallel beta-helix repeat protein
VKTGTTWEDYYRYDNEHQGARAVPTTTSLLFRESGAADSGNAGNGYLIDGVSFASSSPTCTPTGFNGLTAAQIGGNVTGTLNASGCNIGVYYDSAHPGSVSGAEIYGANYYGVVDNGAAVNVTGSSIHHIGETPLDGTQHGNGIYYTNGASGTISGNTVSHYQKNGITAVGGSSVTISGNTVTGEGPVAYIAQNGIEVGSGTSATVSGNTVSGNAYSGTNNASSGGILVFGGPCFGAPYTTGVSVTSNTLTNNDVGIFLYNAAAGCATTSPTKTQNKAVNNIITNGNETNVSGNGYPNGYQAGISDFGNKDNIVNNAISGDGYTNDDGPGTLYTTVDTTGSQAAHVNNNK